MSLGDIAKFRTTKKTVERMAMGVRAIISGRGGGLLLGGVYPFWWAPPEVDLARNDTIPWTDLSAPYIADPMAIADYVFPFHGAWAEWWVILSSSNRVKRYDEVPSTFTDLTPLLFAWGGVWMDAADGPNFWIFVGGLAHPFFPTREIQTITHDMLTVNNLAAGSGFATNNPISCVAYAPELGYFMVCSSTGELRAYDGVNWTAKGNFGAYPYDIEWNGSYFLIVGGFPTRVCTHDGTVLTDLTVASGFANTVIAAKWNGTYFLVGGADGLLKTFDGVNWTTIRDYTVVHPAGSVIYTIAWDGNLWYIGGGDNAPAPGNPFLETYDGVNFTDILADSGFTTAVARLDAHFP